MLTNSKLPMMELDAVVDVPAAHRTSIQTLLSHFLRDEKSLEKIRKDSERRSQAAEYTLVEHGCGDRLGAEQFIARCFAERFGARVDAFMPRLFTLRRYDGTICGAFGLRSAQRKLFIEQYLHRPIEKTITLHTGSTVERRSIVEVGHFSGAFPGAMRTLILLLIERLHREGFEWVAFTGTTQLRNAFYRMGLVPIDIAAATAAAIPVETRPAWGCYYEHAPRVLVGRITDGFAALTRKGNAAVDSGSRS